MSKLPERTKTISISGINYSVKFPNNLQLINIESEKNRLSNGDYSSFLYRVDNSGMLAKLIIDTIATFSVLIPQLIKDLNVKSYMDLDILEQNTLTSVYIDQYYSWYKEWIDILSNPSQVTNEGRDNQVE